MNKKEITSIILIIIGIFLLANNIANNYSIYIPDNPPFRVGGLYRCESCGNWIGVGAVLLILGIILWFKKGDRLLNDAQRASLRNFLKVIYLMLFFLVVIFLNAWLILDPRFKGLFGFGVLAIIDFVAFFTYRAIKRL